MGHRNTSNMNTLVVLSLVVCAVSAGVIPAHHGAHYGGASEQHHSQDEAGNYAYGYSDPNSHKEESGHGGYGTAVKGSYSYVAPDGHVVHNDYYADESGFHSSLAPTAGHNSHHGGHVAHHGLAHHGVAHHGLAHHGVAHHGLAHYGHHGIAHHGISHAHHGVHHAAPYHHGAFSYGVSSSHPVYSTYHH